MRKYFRELITIISSAINYFRKQKYIGLSLICSVMVLFLASCLKDATPLPIAFSPDGKFFATKGPKAIRIFNKEIIKGYGYHSIKLWDTVTKKNIKTIYEKRDCDDEALAIVFYPDNKTVATVGYITIKFWDIESEKEIRSLKYDGHTLAFSLSPIGKVIAFADKNNIKIVNLESGKLMQVLKGHKGDIRSLTFSHDGKLLASGSRDASIKLWDVESGKLFKTLAEDVTSIETVVFSFDGKILLSGGYDYTKIWDIKSMKAICTFPINTGVFWPLANSPDDKFVATNSKSYEDKSFIVWDIASCGEIKKLHTGEHGFYNIIFSPDGHTLAVSTYTTENIQLWDITSGEKIWSFVL